MSLTQHIPVVGRGNAHDGAESEKERSGRRLARGHWVALVLGMLAFLVNIAVLRDRSETVSVAVADGDIAAATELSEDMVRYVEVPADSPLASSMVDATRLQGGGLVTARQIAADEPVVLEAVVDDIPETGLRSMSVPVPAEQAVGGTLQVGDRVDIAYVEGGRASYAVTDVEVIGIRDADSGSVGGQPADQFVMVAVDAWEALQVAVALDSEGVTLVRSTGADRASAGLSTSPDPATAGADDTDGAPDEDPGEDAPEDGTASEDGG